MNLPIKGDVEEFVRNKGQSGQFPSREAVVEAALVRFREEESRSLEGFLDHEFIEFCVREGDDRVTLEKVREATAGIPGSMARNVIEEERADRI